MTISLRFTLLSLSALLASCAGNSTPTSPPVGAPDRTMTSSHFITPMTTSTATTAFNVTALPSGFHVINNTEGYPVLNNNGAVAGWTALGGEIWSVNGDYSVPLHIAVAINDSDDVIGQDSNGASKLFRNGTLAPLNGNATSINNSDVIVGTIPQSDPNAGSQPAYLYPNASPKPMESNPATDTQVGFVNNRGEAAGEQEFGPIGNPYQPFVYPKLPLCQNSNSATEVLGINTNNDLLLLGNSANYLCEGTRAVLISGFPQALNDQNVVVGNGQRSASGSSFAFVRTSEGKYWDLNSLVPSGTPYLSNAIAVNNHDQILATQSIPNSTSLNYFLLTPTSRWYGL